MKSKGPTVLRLHVLHVPGVNRRAFQLLGLLLLLLFGIASAQTSVVSTIPIADAFVRSAAPTDNYGAGGALSVSGSASVNGSGQQTGLSDTLIRFPGDNLAAALDGAFGSANWLITETRLILNEMGAPDNALFGRGIGAFEVFWLASTNWLEGTGKPMAPTTDGVTWSDLAGIVNPNLDVSLGVFTNQGTDGQVSISLSLVEPLLASVRRGRDLCFHLTAASPSVGFTFNSRNFGNTNAQPIFEVTAMAVPTPRIDRIVPGPDNVAIAFSTVANWTWRLQYADTLAADGTGTWTDLTVVPAQSPGAEVVYRDAITNRIRFYRLSVSR